MRQTVRALLDHAALVLAAAGIEAPRREARLLVAHALGASPETLTRDPDAPVAAPGLAALLARRAARAPLAYLTGRREFWGLSFAVSPASLIPRPDSETLIEAALAFRPERAAVRRILDLGTGTGCLLLASLAEFRNAWGLGIDLSPAACALAVRNAAMLEMQARAAFLCADWAAACRGRFDLVLANPPYVARPALAGLMPEVACHEPSLALDGGADGLCAYRRVLPALPSLLAPAGIGILEAGAGQAAAIAKLAADAGLAIVAIRHDIGGIDRAIVLRLAGG